jgi:hypothetical protein
MSQRTNRSLPLATIALLGLTAALSVSALAIRDADSGGPAVTLPTAIEVMLLRAELGPESYAAAGVSSSTLSSQLAGAEESLTPLLTSLASADSDYADARTRRDRLQRLVRSGQGDAQDVTDLVAAKADLADGEAARTAVLDDAFEAATSDLTQAQVATLSQIRANERWNVPVKYKVSARSQADWIAIRDCLAHVRTYARHELDPLPGPSAALAAFDGEQAVSTANSNLDTYLTAVQATWDATFVD